MNIELLIADYGYLAIAIGMIVEGEIALLLGGLAARLGYLDLPIMLLVASAVTVAVDHFYFYLGRLRGVWALSHFPRLQKRAERIFELIRRHQTLFTAGFRFIYGCRIITPILLGSGGARPLRFTVYNLLGTACWVLLFGLLGYNLGEAAKHIISHFRKHELDVALAVIAIGLIWHLVIRIKARCSGSKSSLNNC